MALTITWEGKGIIANADGYPTDTYGTWGELGGGTPSFNPDVYLYGSGSIGNKYASKTGYTYFDIGSGSELDFGASGTEEGEFVYMWINIQSIGQFDTLANKGFAIRLGTDTSNYREWLIAGNDDGNGWTGGWKLFVVDPTTPGSVADTGTFNLSSVRYFGVWIDTVVSVRADSIFLDQIYVGKGLRVTGTSTDLWKDIVDYCNDYTNRAWGVCQEREGIYYFYGKIFLGDSGVTANQSFVDTAANIIKWGKTEYYYESAWRISHPENYSGIEIIDTASYTTTFDDGVIVGSDDGRDGTTFLGDDDLLVAFDLYGGNNTSSLTRLYGTNFRNLRGGINMGNDAQHLFYGGSVIQCGQFDPVGAPVIRNVSFINTKAFETDFTQAWMEDNGTGYTDETTDINDVGTADVNLLPASMAINDAFYFGHQYKFDKITILMSTATDATTVIAWEYYNGTSWTTLTVTDTTSGFENNLLGTVTWTIPGTWTPTRVNTDVAPMYYVRARVTTAGTTQPVASWAYATGPASHGALLWNSSANIQKCSFLANVDDDNDPGGIEMPDAAESLGLTNMTFSGNDVDAINTSSATEEDSYSYSNQDTDVNLNGTNNIVAQTFTTGGTTGKLTRAMFMLKKSGSPTGNMKAELYATSGGAPTGAALATSNLYVANTELTTSYQEFEFEFEDEYTMAATTTYAIAINYSSGDGSNYVAVGVDNSSPGHAGTGYLYTSSWASQTWDVCFWLNYGGFIQIDSTSSNPATAEERHLTLRGATKIVNSVDLTITVQDEDGDPIENAQTAIYTDDANRTELMNEDTTALGIATQPYNYAGDQDIEVRVRKASPSATKYKNFSTLGQIDSGGYTLLVTLVEDPINTS